MQYNHVVREVLKANSFGKLNPAQEKALKSGLLGERNFIVCAPTASGKTVMAEIAMLDMLRKGRKVVYIVPLKALGSEKHREFTKKYAPMGIRVALSIGDLDSTDGWLANYDVVVATSEKLDSLIRHGAEWVSSVGLVIADEIHLLDDAERGPTIEILLTRLRTEANPRILGLSATISNYKELAEWLGADSMESDYRPVKLMTGVCYGKRLVFEEEEMELKSDTLLPELVSETVSRGKQALIFINTRRSAESTAEKLGKLLSNYPSPITRTLMCGKFKVRETNPQMEKLGKIANEVLEALEHPTQQCKHLSECILNGFAFHHSGLAAKQRELVEDAFRDGLIKAICATPTLAAGINMPAWRVIVRDLKRFYSYKGMDYLSTLEINQMCGRAGRPQYDTEGQAVLMAKSEAEAKHAWERYVKGKPEDIRSKLGAEPILKMHALSLIAGSVTRSRRELADFFSKTFYAWHYRDAERLAAKLDGVVSQLKSYGFVAAGGEPIEDNPFRTAIAIRDEKDTKLEATKIGKRVSELYINPDTAYSLIKKIEHASVSAFSDLDLLFMIADTLEMRPYPGIRKNDVKRINDFLAGESETLLFKPPPEWDALYDDYIRTLKTALVLGEWISEAGEDAILEGFNMPPGELRARLDIADWLLYSASELALLCGQSKFITPLKKLGIRIEYGIREELLPFVKLKGVGRVRAREIYAAGMKSIGELRKVPLESLERVVGAKTARSIREQLGEKSTEQEWKF